MKSQIQKKIQADWWAKTFAGAILGLSLSIACASLLTKWALHYLDKGLAPQLGMWSIPWIWLPLFFLAYFIPKGWQAIVIFAVLNVVCYGVLFGLRGLGL